MKSLFQKILSTFASCAVLANTFLFALLLPAAPVAYAAAPPSVPECNGLTATIYVDSGTIIGGPDNGDSYAGTLNGTADDDVMVGSNGEDAINGLGGNDTICGGIQDDIIHGGEGDDWIEGGNGKDDLFGDEGNDTMFGANGGDDMTGGPGIDFCDQGNGPGVDCEADITEGVIVIVKDASPDDAQDFGFTGTNGIGGFSLDDDADGTLSNTETLNLAPGVYAVSEDSPLPAGWVVTSLNCTASPDTGQVSTTSDTVTVNSLSAGDAITCTFTNTLSLNECEDGVDNDNDNLIDFPADPGCSSPTDDDESDGTSECQDGIDNADQDGLADAADPGCWTDPNDSQTYDPTDNDESDGTTQCQDTFDNDQDSVSDAADPGCWTDPNDSQTYDPTDNDESDGTTECQDTIDNSDQDGVADANDPGCYDNQNVYQPTDNDESDATTECQDGIDNADQDGVADAADPGCWTDPDDSQTYDPTDDDESDGTTQCQDTNDNDQDGVSDYPADPGCSSAQDNDESDGTTQCQDGLDNDQDSVSDAADPGCWTDPNDSQTYDPTDNDESDGTTQCQDGLDNDQDSVSDAADPGCWTDPNDSQTYDPTDNNESDGTTECQDGIDNADQDGVADAADPGCYDNQNVYQPTDNDESDGTTECQDTNDNDQDGVSDYPADPGCSSPQDDDESDGTTECQDGIDNADQDGVADAADPGCYDNQNVYQPTDNDESDGTTQCQDGGDNDQDNLTDYPADPGCSSPQDDNESDGTTECQDGIDNSDQDGVADDADPGCWTDPQDPQTYDPTDDDESDGTTQCQDTGDNDQDGVSDYPADPGCSSPQDNDESDGTTQCQDGDDNDQDNLTDYPDDPGCDSPQDNDESDGTSQCQDGLDNDQDSVSDADDPGCWTDPQDPQTYDPTDDDESDGTTQCQDTFDNDQDSVSDADDPGCWTDPQDSQTYDPLDNDESDGTTQCQDTQDNDNDQVADADDPGCWTDPQDSQTYDPLDNDESDGTTQCQDGEDNDDDGLTDYPDDPGCDSPGDDDEQSGDMDFGDAPDDAYRTLMSSNGAKHRIVPGFYLGASVDPEADGQPSVGATGDDAAHTDDEDGVVFNDPLIPGATVSVDVTASSSGYLDAWMDFNSDGDWNDEGEKIFSSEALAGGVNNLEFTIPFYASLGDTYSRFRFSSSGGLASYNPVFTAAIQIVIPIDEAPAPDGEVEDYMVTIVEDDGALIITKSADPSSLVTGQITTYKVVVQNTLATKESFVLSDVLEAGTNGGTLTPDGGSVSTTFIPGGSGSLSGSYPTFFVGLDPEGSVEITYEATASNVNIPFNQSSNFKNTVTLFPGKGGDGDTAYISGDGDGDYPMAMTTVVVRGPVKSTGGGGGGGGSTVCRDDKRPVFSDISPAKQAVLNDLNQVSFVASSNTDVGSAYIKVNTVLVAHNVETLGDGSYRITADVSGMNLSGQVFIELYALSEPRCQRNAVYYMTVDPDAEEDSEGVPFQEGPGGLLFSDDEENCWSANFDLTRGCVAEMILDKFGADYSDQRVKNCYPDVSTDHPRNQPICMAKELDIMWGYGDGLFRPDRIVTKAEAVKSLYKATDRRYVAGLPLVCGDLMTGAWYIPSQKTGIFDGVVIPSDREMCYPGKILSRGEFLDLINLFFGS